MPGHSPITIISLAMKQHSPLILNGTPVESSHIAKPIKKKTNIKYIKQIFQLV
jgi:hypothetical protein